MKQLLSREILETYHFERYPARLITCFKDWKYQVCIKLRCHKVSRRPVPALVMFKSFKSGKEMKGHHIRPGSDDRRRLSEILFLLAAKLKYDLLDNSAYDNSGFLHSLEIKELNEAGLTKVQKDTYRSVYRLYSNAEATRSSEGILLRKLFMEPLQLWHLICWHGHIGQGWKDQSIVWWLNILPHDISFQDERGNAIPDETLKKILGSLFPKECFLNNAQWEDFSKILEEHAVDVSRKRKREQTTDRVGEVAPPYNVGFDPSLLSYIIDLSPVFDQYTDFVGRRYLHDAVDSHIKTRKSGYVIIEDSVGMGKTAFVIDRVRNSSSQYVFCHLINRTMPGWDNPDLFLMSLYVQLLEKFNLPEPEGNQNMSPVIKFNRTLIEISRQLPPGKTVIIYLDGLNEAFGETGFYRHRWPRVLPEVLPAGIHFVITSRPGKHLDFFSDPEKYPRIRIEDTGSKNDNRGDIRHYIEECNRLLSLSLSRKFIDTAIERSEGNFLYTVLFIKDIKRRSPEERTITRIPYGLEGLIKQEWAQVIAALGKKHIGRRQFLDISSILTAAFGPLTPAHLDELVGLDEWETSVELLNEFFQPQAGCNRENKYFQFWHTAFAEFIENELGPARTRKAHRQLAQACRKWQSMTVDAVQGYALDNWSRHLIIAQDWNEVGQVFCSPDYLKERIKQGTYNNLLMDVECCADHTGVEERFRKSFRILHRFLRRRSPWFHEHPESIGQEIINELQTEKQEPLADWLPKANAVEKPWLRKLSGPPNLVSRGHSRIVMSVKFSPPHGKQIASGGDDNTLRVWDASTLESLFVCSLHTGCINCVAYSPDGKKIASGSDDKTVRIWDASSGACLAKCEGHKDRVNSIAFSPDGQRVASAGSDNSVRIWDVGTGTCLANCVGHTSIVVRVVFSPDNCRIASASWDKTVKIWEGSRCIATFGEHSDKVIAAAFVRSGKAVISVSWDGKIHIWSITTRERVPLRNESLNLLWKDSFEPQDIHLRTDKLPDELWVFDGKKQEPITAYVPSLGEARILLLLPDSRRILAMTGGDSLQMWNGKADKSIKLSHKQDPPTGCLAASLDGQRICAGGCDGSLKIWDARKGSYIMGVSGCGIGAPKGLIASDVPGTAAISPNGKFLAFGRDFLTMRNVETGKEVWKSPDQSDSWSHRASSIAFFPDEERFVSGHNNGKLKIWQVKTGKCLSSRNGHSPMKVKSVMVSRDGRKIVSADSNLKVKVWNAATGKCILEPKWVPAELDAQISNLAYAPNGENIAIGLENGKIIFLNSLTGERAASCKAHSKCVTAMLFSPDGRRLLSGSQDGLLKKWAFQSSRGTAEVCNRNCIIKTMGIASSTNGLIVAVGQEDGRVCFWDGEMHNTSNVLFFERLILTLSFSSDGARIFIADETGRFFSYELIGF